MRLCNARGTRYPADMVRANSTSILGRLRASTQLVVWVLALFLMKVGMVAACTVHEMEDSRLQVASNLTLDQGDVGASFAVEDDSSTSAHTAGGCVDCSCHHASTLPSYSETLAIVPTGMALPLLALRQPVVALSRELRPPIL